MNTISIDSGSSYMKACADEETCLRIPAVVHRVQEALLYDGPDVLRVDSASYLVGDGALAVQSAPSYPHDEPNYHGGRMQRVQVCHALAQLGVTDGAEPLLYLSLPYTQHRDEATRKRCWDALRHCAWEDANGTHNVRFADVSFIPQGVGALRQYQLAHDARPPRIACMIDIGSRTTDVVMVRHDGGRAAYALQACTSLTDLHTTGFFQAWCEAISRAHDIAGRKLCYYALMGDAAVGHLTLQHYGRQLPLDASYRDTCTAFTARLRSQIEAVAGSLWPAVEAVILTGGGAQLVDRQEWPDERLTVLTSTANAVGQMAWAQAQRAAA